jgi:signal transduction histidine kinase
MVNVNKLFRRLSIRTKLVIAFVLLGVVPVAIVGGYGAVFSFSLLNQTVLDGLREGVSLKAGEVQQFLETVREDVVFLTRLPVLQVLVAAGPDRPRAAAEAVERAFLAFSQSRKAYYQVRYLDARGREVVRVDFDGARHLVVPAAALQDKSDRYYFREAMQLPAGAVYVSPMDLNEERGEVERPARPVVRYGTRVTDRQGTARGLVIVNLYASKILAQVVSLGRERGTVFLVDARGIYLADSRRMGSEAGHLVAEAGDRLDRDFPREIAATVLAGTAGAAVEPGLRGRILAFAPIRPGPGRDAWIVAHAYGKAEVLSSIRSLQLLVVLLGAGVLVVAVVVGVAAARHFTRPIAALAGAAEAVAAGDFDRTIRVETNDELEDLGHQFNRMAGHLKQHERELLHAREHAERKAQEARALAGIGTEISRLRSLPRILQTVVDKARELLGGDVAILCLSEPGAGLRVGAACGVSGALALRPGQAPEANGCAKVECPDALCPVAHGTSLPTHFAVPLRCGERVVGNLCVGFRTSRVVEQDELEFLEGLGNQAAVAIENARLHREVRERAALEERERIGQDLHDGIIQSIYATGLGLEECVRLAEEEPREVKARVETAIESLNTVIRDVRSYIVGLQPEHLQEWGLAASLGHLTRGLALNAPLQAELVPRGTARLDFELR